MNDFQSTRDSESSWTYRDDSDPPAGVALAEPRLIAMSESGNVTTCTYYCEPRPPLFQVEHDWEEKVIRITTAKDGVVSKFYDRAARFLVVEQDEKTGELKPVIENGLPKIIRLCKEAGL